MVAKRLLLFCVLLLVAHGCGQNPPAAAPAVPAGTNAPPLPEPDPKLWAGKKWDDAVIDYLSTASIFVSSMKEINAASDIGPNQAAVLLAAQHHRVARFEIVALSKGKSLDPDTHQKLNDASAAVSHEVARLLAIPEAKQALREAFLLVRTAPALKP